ncbi:uncharacterized protein LY79DRAFT_190871 [Colletotrichum navitas]|uniref:Uncharacterized protein n=1 Tax=Colletotrichum navitas TaxID=681940 RepID=A0AAD8V5B0_9PEZI|nr:uncharacterized protein LY79DRAFT_190871 [Colletotrichum navitas]KAK1593208.1 hypothetical protein LY79DRAFT_190871 [Colletotrichum navitas]
MVSVLVVSRPGGWAGCCGRQRDGCKAMGCQKLFPSPFALVPGDRRWEVCMMKQHRKGHCPKRGRHKLKSILWVQVVQSRGYSAARLLLKLDVHVVRACGQAACCFANLQRGTGSRYEDRRLSMINDDLPRAINISRSPPFVSASVGSNGAILCISALE